MGCRGGQGALGGLQVPGGVGVPGAEPPVAAQGDPCPARHVPAAPPATPRQRPMGGGGGSGARRGLAEELPEPLHCFIEERRSEALIGGGAEGACPSCLG